MGKRRKTQDPSYWRLLICDLRFWKSKIKNLKSKIVCVFLILALCFSLLAASETTNKTTNTVVYNCTAKETNIDRKSGVTILKGDAKVRSNGDYLNADQITMYRDVKTGELIKIEAVGKVEMKEKDMTATCVRAIFYEKEERIELEGTKDSPAVVDDGKNRIEAPVITYFRKDDRIEAKDNVTARITVERKEGEVKEKAEEKE